MELLPLLALALDVPGGGKLVGAREPFRVPLIDLAADEARRVTVDREPGVYLGHPSTALLPDGRTIICVYPKGHGRGPIIMKRSEDGGLTWSERLPVPESWATSKETPTIHLVYDRAGRRRLVLFSGLYPIRMAVSEDDGRTWSELRPIGDFGGIVAMASVVELKGGRYMAFFHDDGRFLRARGSGQRRFAVYGTVSSDGGLTWSQPRELISHEEAWLCEPGVFRSPDGRQLAMLLREESRKLNSFVCFSDDEGDSWGGLRQVGPELTGDRHVARYGLDGRLVVVFRDMARGSPWRGDFVAWVGTYEDILRGRPGQYRVRLLDNRASPGETGYAGLEVLPDGTFVATTYCSPAGGELPCVVSVRFRLEEFDEMAGR